MVLLSGFTFSLIPLKPDTKKSLVCEVYQEKKMKSEKTAVACQTRVSISNSRPTESFISSSLFSVGLFFIVFLRDAQVVVDLI